jgi:AcrR family transcriptional regulator
MSSTSPASGNRAALLAAARTCLLERGYARTTARDIAGRAGVSLAAIGYHFGSKEALLDAALVAAVREWGDVLESAGLPDSGLSPADRFAAVWDYVMASVVRDRQLWAVQVELIAEAARDPERAAVVVTENEVARAEFARLFGVPAEQGAILQLLVRGAVAGLLLDPSDVVDARALFGHLSALAALGGPAAGDSDASDSDASV